MVNETIAAGGKTVEKFLGTFRKLLTESEWQTVMSAGTEWKQLANFYRIWVSG